MSAAFPKASQRRAVHRALDAVRCPTCNCQSLALMRGAALQGICGRCGAACSLSIDYSTRTSSYSGNSTVKAHIVATAS